MNGSPEISAPEGTTGQFTQPCANSDEYQIQARLEDCRALEAAVLTAAVAAAMTTAADDKAWDVLNPLLDREQTLRYRRGNYGKLADKAGLESFEVWWERFSREKNIQIPLRTVQYHLKQYREKKRGELRPEPKPKPKAPKTASPAVEKKMALALLAVLEMIANIDEHGRATLSPEDIELVRKMAPSADVLNRIASRVPDELGGPEAPQPAPQASAEESKKIDTRRSDLEPKRPTLKLEDMDGLSDEDIEKLMPIVEPIPAAVTGEQRAEIIYRYAKVFAKQFRDPAVGGFSIKVRHIPAKSMALAQRGLSQDDRQQSLFEMSAPNSQATIEKIAS